LPERDDADLFANLRTKRVRIVDAIRTKTQSHQTHTKPAEGVHGAIQAMDEIADSDILISVSYPILELTYVLGNHFGLIGFVYL
jgi:hypothetical protein